MLTMWKLIELALGKDEASKVDTAIPQAIYSTMNAGRREDVAGWYYEAPTFKLMGRLLTKTECWGRIDQRVLAGELRLMLMEHDMTYEIKDWPCRRTHIEKGHVQIEEVVNVPASSR